MRKLYGVIRASTVLCLCLLSLIAFGKPAEERNIKRHNCGLLNGLRNSGGLSRTSVLILVHLSTAARFNLPALAKSLKRAEFQSA